MVPQVHPHVPIWISTPLPTSQQLNTLGIFELQNPKEYLSEMAKA